MKSLFALIGAFPRIEVLLRALYWNFPAIHKQLAKYKKTFFGSTHRKNERCFTLTELRKEIQSHGIASGDILIAHSNMQSIVRNGISEENLIALLLDIIGPNGTLVLPAIPIFKEAPQGTSRITKDISNEVWIYNVQRTPPWTGMLPFVLMRSPDARRGRHPLNTVVAKGAHVKELFKNELSVPGALACGLESPWFYCWQNKAKILALDVDLAHSGMTMMHVAEDCFEKDWPIENWYRERTFKIIDNGEEDLVYVRERHPRWAIHYAERKLTHDLKKYGLCHSSKLGGTSIVSIESTVLMDFLTEKRARGYPYFLWKHLQ